jgi:hypothetical protein
MGQDDELASDPDAGPRFRMWVTGWSGGTALLWAVLAIWRTVTFDSAQFAVLVFFGMLNLAVVSRVIFPGGRTV